MLRNDHAVSDEELSERVAQGDHPSLETLYRRHAGDIVRYLTLLGAPPDWVEDGTHEVFLKVWTALERGQRPVKFRVWVRRIAHNVLIDYLRRPEQKREVAGEQHPERITEPDLDLAMDVGVALDQLEWSLREILVLHFYQDLSLKDIAAVVDIPLGTVKSRLARAYRQVATLIRDGPRHDAPEGLTKGVHRR